MDDAEAARVALTAMLAGLYTYRAAQAMHRQHPRWCRCPYCHAAVAASFGDDGPSRSLTWMLYLGLAGRT